MVHCTVLSSSPASLARGESGLVEVELFLTAPSTDLNITIANTLGYDDVSVRIEYGQILVWIVFIQL